MEANICLPLLGSFPCLQHPSFLRPFNHLQYFFHSVQNENKILRLSLLGLHPVVLWCGGLLSLSILSSSHGHPHPGGGEMCFSTLLVYLPERKLCSALVPKGPCIESMGPRMVLLESGRPLFITGLIPKEDCGPSSHFRCLVACDVNSLSLAFTMP